MNVTRIFSEHKNFKYTDKSRSGNSKATIRREKWKVAWSKYKADRRGRLL